MIRKNKNKGFSLIELIIVIAILAVLVAIVAPQYFQYVEKSRKAVCVNNRDEVRRQYAAALLMSKADGDDKSCPEILKEVMELSGGKEDGTVNGVAAYTGICPSSGKVSGAFDTFGNVTLYCTEHGAEGADAMAGAISNAVITGAATPANKTAALECLKSQGWQFDSEAVNDSSLDGYTQMIKKALGPVVDRNCSWAVKAQALDEKGNVSELAVYVTTGPKLTTESKGSVEAIKYVYNTDGVLLTTEKVNVSVVTKSASVGGQSVRYPALKVS